MRHAKSDIIIIMPCAPKSAQRLAERRVSEESESA